MNERMDERYGLDTPQEEAREATDLRAKYQALEKERDALLRRESRHGAEVWKQVCASEVFQELKHGKYRDILDLLADGCISVGKAAQSIAERAGGVEPLLPEYQPMACDHPPSLMLKSAETGEPLYCEMCNTINERDDALKMEAEYKAERDGLKTALSKPWEHSEHWRNPETGQIECECCCKWALDMEALEKENAAIKQQVADGDLAFNHANEVVGKLEAQVARLSAPVTVQDLKRHGVQGLCAASAVHGANRLIASRTTPAKETES